MKQTRSRGLEPVTADVTVPLSRERAFELFTTEMGRWWPTGTHSVREDPAARVTVEPREGGRVFETSPDGRESDWGTVLTWDPPGRFAMTWHPGREPETAQRVDVRFTEDAGGTRVVLEHTGWDALGEGAAEMRDQYVDGWVYVLGLYEAAVG